MSSKKDQTPTAQDMNNIWSHYQAMGMDTYGSGLTQSNTNKPEAKLDDKNGQESVA